MTHESLARLIAWRDGHTETSALNWNDFRELITEAEARRATQAAFRAELLRLGVAAPWRLCVEDCARIRDEDGAPIAVVETPDAAKMTEIAIGQIVVRAVNAAAGIEEDGDV